MQIVRNLVTGEMYTIKEKDRSLHSLANGVTGTGKTSSCFTCAIARDLEQITHNLNYQKEIISKWLMEGRVVMKQPMTDDNFDIDNFEPVKKEDKDIVTDLKWKAKLAGITAMAPNASFSDEVYSLCKAAGLNKINRLDPMLDTKTGHLKEGFIGFNPLYINPKLSKMEWMIEVSRKAVMFADVMQAIYDSSGQSNPYFSSLNRNITTTVTMLVILTYPALHNGLQPTPEIVQIILNDFGKAKPYREMLVKLFAEKDANGYAKNANNRPVLTNFQGVLDVTDQELLGVGAERMFDQSTGLRIIINSFLTNPLIRNILCCDRTIDLDEALEKGEVTLVNYALELGNDSKAFGLFFLLSFINAVYRRPGTEHTRIPNFFYIDELPVLLHPAIDSCFSLFRQYRVAMFVAIQSLSQMEKLQSTAFLKDLLLGNCAHHFVFGRVAPAEMKLYQELAGTSHQLTIQDGIKESSLTADNPNIMYDHKESISRENNIFGSQVRERDFQEVTVVSVDNGSPVAAFFGKVSFLPKYKRIRKPRYRVDFTKYQPKQIEISNTTAAVNEEQNRVSLFGTYGKVTSKDNFKEGNSNDGPVNGVIENEVAREVPAFMRQLKSHTVPAEDTSISMDFKEVLPKEQVITEEEDDDMESIEIDL